MKRFTLCWLLGCTLVSFLSAQTVINNPEKPLNGTAGRTVGIQEILRITDESGNFYFQYPRFIKVAEDNTIFVYDQDELLRFDPNGKFLHNFFKKGQGPGELIHLVKYKVID